MKGGLGLWIGLSYSARESIAHPTVVLVVEKEMPYGLGFRVYGLGFRIAGLMLTIFLQCQSADAKSPCRPHLSRWTGPEDSWDPSISGHRTHPFGRMRRKKVTKSCQHVTPARSTPNPAGSFYTNPGQQSLNGPGR